MVIGLQFAFLCVISLSGLGIRVMMASYSEFGSVPSSAVFGNNFRSIGIISYLNVWWNSPVNLCGPGVLLSGSFKIIDSISVFVNDLFRFSIFFLVQS